MTGRARKIDRSMSAAERIELLGAAMRPHGAEIYSVGVQAIFDEAGR